MQPSPFCPTLRLCLPSRPTRWIGGFIGLRLSVAVYNADFGDHRVAATAITFTLAAISLIVLIAPASGYIRSVNAYNKECAAYEKALDDYRDKHPVASADDEDESQDDRRRD